MPVLENVEDVTMYTPGGHHPIDLGDVVVHRFRIIHKLGNGGFALVWLARDLDQDRNVALKILRADASDREVNFLEYLKAAARNLVEGVAVLHAAGVCHGGKYYSPDF